MPGFDEQTFPFLVCSGEETFNVINVRDFSQDVLIRASGKNFFSQKAASFSMIEEESTSFTMHFATRTITAENKRLKQWHCMDFKEDFIM